MTPLLGWGEGGPPYLFKGSCNTIVLSLEWKEGPPYSNSTSDLTESFMITHYWLGGIISSIFFFRLTQRNMYRTFPIAAIHYFFLFGSIVVELFSSFLPSISPQWSIFQESRKNSWRAAQLPSLPFALLSLCRLSPFLGCTKFGLDSS